MALAQLHEAVRLSARRRAAASFVVLGIVSGCRDGGGAEETGASDAGPSCTFEDVADAGAVSFESDMMPFFSYTCAFGGCHDGATRQMGLYLGPNFRDGPADAATRAEVHASLLAPAATTKDLPRITPHEPRKSFLMLKVLGCANHMGLTCIYSSADEPCGQRMPALSDELPEEKRRLIAAWIAQGAPGP